MATDDIMLADVRASMAEIIHDQARELASLRRHYAAAQAAMTPDHKQMAEAILRSMAEEAANLRPMFDEQERAVVREALAAFQPAEQDYEGRQTVADIMEKLDAMAAVEKAS